LTVYPIVLDFQHQEVYEAARRAADRIITEAQKQ
jgi:hypothetical protein